VLQWRRQTEKRFASYKSGDILIKNENVEFPPKKAKINVL